MSLRRLQTEWSERDNFTVAYPFITHYPAAPPRDVNCWKFFIDLHKGAEEVGARRFIVVSDSFGR